MTIAFWCVGIAGLLPILWAGVAKFIMGFKLENNSNPRDFLATAQGKAKRANWAQVNSWEAFSPFAAAVIIASICGVAENCMDSIAITFIIARVGYGIAYIQDWHIFRSLVWALGLLATLTLYVAAAMVVR